MASRCQKFVPNIFNKTKCQTCFAQREQHSPEALESSKVARKPTKCGYLFVAPEEFDFSNPLDRTRRWQRRFFVLYDDGALTYSVDENVDTVPQGELNMNKCTDVLECETVTGHEFSISVATPDKTVYIKGTCKEEIGSWYKVLVAFPDEVKARKKKGPVLPWMQSIKDAKQKSSTKAAPDIVTLVAPGGSSQHATRPHHNNFHDTYVEPHSKDTVDNKENILYSHQVIPKNTKGEVKMDSRHRMSPDRERSPMTFKGVRSLKHKHDKAYRDNLRKANSLNDLSAAVLSPDDDLENSIPRRRSDLGTEAELRSVRTAQPQAATPAKPKETSQRTKPRSRRPVSDVFPSGVPVSSTRSQTVPNETDELKMARNEERSGRRRRTHDGINGPERLTRRSLRQEDLPVDLMYMKRGWLVMRAVGEIDWVKHWCVLSGTALKYYSDSKSEEKQDLEGAIDLTGCYDVTEAEVSKNYGFIIQTKYGDYMMSAMTAGIRCSWVQAIKKCISTNPPTSQEEAVTPSGASSLNQEPKLSPAGTDSVPAHGASSKPPKASSPPHESRIPNHMTKRGESSAPEHTGSGPVEKNSIALSRSPKKIFDSDKDSKRTVRTQPDGRTEPSPENVDSVSQKHVNDSRSKQKPKEAVKSSRRPTKDVQPQSKDASQKSQFSPEQNKPSTSNLESSTVAGANDSSKVRPRNNSGSESSRAKSPSRKAPSAKIKTKVSKSLRPRSPPPTGGSSQEDDLSFDQIVRRNTQELPPDFRVDDLIEQKWGELEMTSNSSGSPTGSHSSQSPRSTSLSQDLTDNEAFSILQAELESTQGNSSQKLQDLQAKLTEIQNKCDNANQQVKSLERQLRNAEKASSKKDKDVEEMKEKMEICFGQLDETQDQLKTSVENLKSEKEKFNRHKKELEGQVARLQKSLGQREEVYKKREKEMEEMQSQFKDLTTALEEKETELQETREEVKVIGRLSRDLVAKSDKVEHLEKEVKELKRDVSQKDKCLKSLNEEHDLKIHEVEMTLTREKQEIEKQYLELKAEITNLRKQSNITDSINTDMADILREKDETIAQLEEKVIEQDNKIEEINEELQIESEDNHVLQQSLDKSFTDNDSLQKELKVSQQQVEILQSDLKAAEEIRDHCKSQVIDLGKKNDKYRQEISALEDEVQKNLQLNSDLSTRADMNEQDLKEAMEKLEMAENEIAELKSRGKNDTDVEKLESKYKSALKELKKLEGIVDEYKVKLGAQQKMHQKELEKKDNDILENTKKISELEPEISVLKQSIKKEKELSEKQKLSLADIITVKSELEKRVSESTKEKKEIQSKYKEVLEEMKAAKEALGSSSEHCSQLEANSDRLEEQIQQLESEHEDQCAVMDARIAGLQQKLTEALVQTARVQAENDKLLKARNGFGDGALTPIAEEDSLVELNTKIQDQNQEIEKLKSVSEKDQKHIQELQSELKTFKDRSNKTNQVLLSGSLPCDNKEIESLKASLLDIQAKLNVTETAVSDCRSKLLDVVQSLKTFPSSPTKDNYTATIGKLERNIKDILKGIGTQETEVLSGEPGPSLEVDPDLKAFAEKLAIEAIVLGQLACFVKTSLASSLSQKSHYLCEIQQASDKITELQAVMEKMETCSSKEESLKNEKDKSLVSFASLVSDKIILEGELMAMIDKLQGGTVGELNPTNLEECPTHQQSLLGEIVGRAHGNLFTCSGYAETGLDNRTLVNHSLTNTICQLHQQLTEGIPEEEMFSQEIDTKKESVFTKATDVSHMVDSYVEQKIKEIARSLVSDAVKEGKKEAVDLCRMDMVEKEVTELVKKYAGEYRNNFDAVPVKESEKESSSSTSIDRKQMIEQAVEREVDYFLESVKESCFSELQHMESSSETSSKDDKHVSQEELSQLADVLAKRAVISGLVGHIAVNQNSQKSNGTARRSSRAGYDSPRGSISETLALEASRRQGMLTLLQDDNTELGKQVRHLVRELAIVDLKLDARLEPLNSYADKIAREAIYQAQMVYLIKRFNCISSYELEELKIKHKKEVARLEAEKEKQSAVTGAVDSESMSEEIAARVETALMEQEDAHIQEIEELKQKHVAQRQGLKMEIQELQSQLENFQQMEHTDNTISDQKVTELEDLLQENNKQHLQEVQELKEQVQEMLELTDKLKADLDRKESEIKKLQHDLEREKQLHQADLDRLNTVVAGDSTDDRLQALLSSKTAEIQQQMENMQADYEQELAVQKAAHRRELAGSKDEMMKLLAAAESKSLLCDEESIKKKYTTEIGSIKDIYDRGFASMDKSHRKVLADMRRSNKREIEALRVEKEQALEEETRATQAAMDAMKKAHEAELQKERNKFLDVMAKTYSQADMDSLQRQHEEDLDLIQSEIKQLSECYSIKCIENAALTNRLESQTQSLHESRRRVQELLIRNGDLNTRLKQDIDRLFKQLKQSTSSPGSSPAGKPGDVRAVKMTLKLKETEIDQLQEEIGGLRAQLDSTSQELQENIENNHCLNQEKELQKKMYENQLSELRKRLDELECSDVESDTTDTLSPHGDPFDDDPEGGPFSSHRSVEKRLSREGSGQGSRPPSGEDPATPVALPPISTFLSGQSSQGVKSAVKPAPLNVKDFLSRQKKVRRSLSTPSISMQELNTARQLALSEGGDSSQGQESGHVMKGSEAVDSNESEA